MAYKIFISIILVIFFNNTFAQNISALGIDYLEVSENPIIAEAMLEMEPALIKYYSKGKWAKSTKKNRIYALRLAASTLGRDKISKYSYKVISEVSPNAPLKFLKLNKSKYPNLWAFGNDVRLDKELADSKWLYKALHGKEWKDKPKK